MELVQDARDKSELRRSLEFLGPFEIYWPDRAALIRSLELFATFHLSHGTGMIDSLIAASALSLDTELCTFNTKHFKHIPGLRLTCPYDRN